MNKLPLKIFSVVLALTFGGCDNPVTLKNSEGVNESLANDATKDPEKASGGKEYVVLDEDLSRLKQDFNAHQGQLRLFFIVGPTCGICLRGMVDLQDKFLQSLQSDARLHTFVVHVPALGAEEKDIAPTLSLMNGPRIKHYWDGVGYTGLDFKKALEIDIYAWDVWLIYEPGATWESGAIPPKPVFWQHQLGSLDPQDHLDKTIFAQEVHQRIANVAALEQNKAQSNSFKSREFDLLPVAQPRGHMITHNIRSRGGYRRLKTIEAMSFRGKTEIRGENFPVEIKLQRPNLYNRTVNHVDGMVQSNWNGERSSFTREEQLAIPKDLMGEMLRGFEFDGWMVEWKDKGHQIWRLGMKKMGDRLPWLMEAEIKNGQIWHVYVDSHTGDTFRKALVNKNGEEILALEYDDFSDVEGFRLPHTVSYFNRDRLLATDRYDAIKLSIKDNEEVSVLSH